MIKQLSTKTVIIDGREYPVRVFESAESSASRRGRKAAQTQAHDEATWERNREAMAEAAYVNGHHPLSESYNLEEGA